MSRSSTRGGQNRGAGLVWLLTAAVTVAVLLIAWLYVRDLNSVGPQVDLRLPVTPALPSPAPMPNPQPTPLPTPG